MKRIIGILLAVILAAPLDAQLLEITVLDAVVLTTTSPLPNATRDVLYSYHLTAEGGTGNYTWSLKSPLPDGLELNTVTGEISGTPTMSGTVTFDVDVVDAVEAPVPKPIPPAGRCIDNPILGPLGFESGIFPKKADNPTSYWDDFNNDGSIVTDATANGGKSLRNDWVVAASDQAAGMFAVFSPYVTRVYASFRYKQDATFDNSGIKKTLRFRGQGFSQMVGTLNIQWDSWNWGYDDLGSPNLKINVGPVTGFSPDELRGSWHTYEVLNDITTSGALHMRLWIDGTLKMDHIYNASNQGLEIAIVGFLGTFNAPGALGSDWIDDLFVNVNCER